MFGGTNLFEMLTPEVGVFVPPKVKTNVVRLLPNGAQHKKLMKIANAFAKMWNELNYERRRQWFEKKKIDFKGTEKKYYEKYQPILKVNAGRVIKLNNEAWRSFFELLKLKKEGKLPKWLKPNPPGYWKDRVWKRRELIIVVRSDRYVVNPIEKTIYLKDWKMRIKFAGEIRWSGKQGDLIIKYDPIYHCWYAHIPVTVGEKGRAQIYIKYGRDKVVLHKPKGNLKAGIDPGVVNLLAIYVDNGLGILIKGGVRNSIYHYWTRRIAEAQSIRDKLKRIYPNSPWIIFYHKEVRRYYIVRERQIEQIDKNVASFIAKLLWNLGVSEVAIGYPYDIIHEEGNEYTVNIWQYRSLILRLAEKLTEYGIKVYIVKERGTSRKCSLCGEVHENARVHRGLYICRKYNQKLNADLNSAINIYNKVFGKAKYNIKKIETYIPTLNKIITPKRGNTLRPRV